MLIDWFTVGAQALNFLILVWLMKHFLYKPILNAIDTREKLIAAELADAAAKKNDAQKDRDEFQHKNEEFEKQRVALLAKAKDDANAEGQRLLDVARKAADALAAKRQEALRNEAITLNQSLSRMAQKEVFAITRKALTDLATTSLEERMGEVFDRRLRGLDAKTNGILAEALKKSSDPAVIRSVFDLPVAQQAAIQNALNETFASEIHVRFETSPELVSGIELSVNGQKTGWSIAEYLKSLEKGVDDLMKAQEKPAPKTEAKAEKTPPPEVKPQPQPEPPPKAKPINETDPNATPKATPQAEPETESKAKPKQEEPTLVPATHE